MWEFQGTHLWSISHQFQDMRTAGTQSTQRARPAAKRSRREGGGSAPAALSLMGPSPPWRRLSPACCWFQANKYLLCHPLMNIHLPKGIFSGSRHSHGDFPLNQVVFMSSGWEPPSTISMSRHMIQMFGWKRQLSFCCSPPDSMPLKV